MKNAKLLLCALAMLAFIGCDGKEPVGPGGKNTLAYTKWKLIGFFDVNENKLTEPVVAESCDNCYTLQFYDTTGCNGRAVKNSFRGYYRANYTYSTIEFVDSLSETLVEEPDEEANRYLADLQNVNAFELKDVELKLYYNNKKNYLLFKRRQ